MLDAVGDQQTPAGLDHIPFRGIVRKKYLEATLKNIEALGIDMTVQGTSLPGAMRVRKRTVSPGVMPIRATISKRAPTISIMSPSLTSSTMNILRVSRRAMRRT
jgi:hypothetical protein